MSLKNAWTAGPLVIVLMIFASFTAGETSGNDSRPIPSVRVLMIVGGDYHDYVSLPGKLVKNLEGRGGVAMEILNDLGELTPERIAACDVLLFNDCRQDEIAEPVRRAIIGHVESGSGLIVMHCSMWSYQWWPEWTPLVGGFAPGHDRYATFPVTVLDRGHPVTRRQPHRFEITDEPYIVNRREEDANVLVRTSDIRKDMKQELRETPEPQVWTRRQGKGRVLAVTFGHDEKGQSNPHFLALMHDGILWAAGRALRPVNNVLSEREREQGFVFLFDGQSLEDWEVDTKEVWQVREGSVVGEVKDDDAHERRESAREYRLRHVRPKAKAGAGSVPASGELRFSLRLQIEGEVRSEPFTRAQRHRWWTLLCRQGVDARPPELDAGSLDDHLKESAILDGWNEVALRFEPEGVALSLNGQASFKLEARDGKTAGGAPAFQWVLPRAKGARLMLRNVRFTSRQVLEPAGGDPRPG